MGFGWRDTTYAWETRGKKGKGQAKKDTFVLRFYVNSRTMMASSSERPTDQNWMKSKIVVYVCACCSRRSRKREGDFHFTYKYVWAMCRTTTMYAYAATMKPSL